MSNVFVELTTIDEIKVHPNASKLEVAVIKGLQTVVGKGNFQKGQRVVLFPPN